MKSDATDPPGQVDTMRITMSMNIGKDGVQTGVQNRRVDGGTSGFEIQFRRQTEMGQHLMTMVPQLINAAEVFPIRQSRSSDGLIELLDRHSILIMQKLLLQIMKADRGFGKMIVNRIDAAR